MGLEAGDMRRGVLVVAMVALLAGGCDLVTTPTVSGGPGCRKLVRQDAADYSNFVKLNGITYTTDRPAVGRTLREGDLGQVHATVRCSLREKMDPTQGELQDGDAAYLEAGSPLYQVRGYRPSFRLAARQDGRLVLFEADTNPEARAGRDLLDLEGKVRRISVNSRADATTELGVITDPGQVAGMVRMLLAGPVDQRVQPAAEQPAWLLAFHLRDGTATVRAYDPAQRRVERGILVARRSVSWSRPLPPDRRSDGQVEARDRPVGRSQPGTGRQKRGQAPANSPAGLAGRPSSCHTVRPTPSDWGGGAAPRPGTRT
jgi:hypothetical protein